MSTPPRVPINRDLEDLHNKIADLTGNVHQLERELEGYRQQEAEKDTAQEKAEETERKKQQRIEKQQAQAARALDAARADAIRAIAKLLPQAVKQARAGKPALLRMILRATR